MRYLDFELKIDRGTGLDYPVCVTRSPAGEGTGVMRFPYDAMALETQLRAVEMALLRSGARRRRVASRDETTVEDFGRGLHEALLSDDIRSLFEVSRREAQRQQCGLRIKLRISAPELAALPWEFLYDAREGEFLCLERSTPLVRYLELPSPVETLEVTTGPLRILAMVASPDDQDPIDILHERERLTLALEPLTADGRVELHWLAGQSWRDLQRALRHGPWHVLHYIGHGAFDAEADQGVLALREDDGSTYRLTASRLGRLLDDHHSLRLVVLNSCEGARGSAKDIFSSTAAALMRRGVPAVLAMQYEITDDAAIEFARSFYEAVADDQAVDAAVTEARIAVSLALGNTLEWAVPVLHLRTPDGQLFSGHRWKAISAPSNDSPADVTTVAPADVTTVAPADMPTVAPADMPTVAPADMPTVAPADMPTVAPADMPGRRLTTALRPPLVLAVAVVLAALIAVAMVAIPRANRGTPRTQTAAATDRPTQAWRFSAGGFVSSRPAVTGGKVFFGSQSQRVYAVDALTGQERWRFDTQKIVFSSPRVAGGLLYIGSRDGNLYALNEATGQERWRFTTTTPAQAGFNNSAGVQSSPVVAGGTVYVGSDDGRVYAVDAETGQERWRFETGGSVFSSPTVTGRAVVVGSFDGSIYSLDAATGTKRWRVQTGGQVWSSPTVAKGVAFVGSNDKFLYALDAATGEQRWRFGTKGTVSSSPAVVNGIVYVGSFDHGVYAVDAATGRQRWRFETGNVVFSSPTVRDGVVYVGSHDSFLYAIDAASGRERWRFKTSGLIGSSPTASDGLVYVGSDDGSLYAVRPPAGG